VDRQTIEVRGFKWPHRPTSVSMACHLGDDAFGRWLGIVQGTSWWAADRTRSGVFETSFVKLVPNDTFWTVCFNSMDPVVDVDIVYPVRWVGDTLEEIDIELDILRSAEGHVWVRDREEFDHVREAYALPDDIAVQAANMCEEIRALVEGGAEPFADVGHTWLTRFLADTGAR